MQDNTTRKPVVISMGDPAGIGPETIVKAFRDAPDLLQGCFVAGDVATMRRAVGFVSSPSNPVQLPWPVAQIGAPKAIADVPPRCIPVMQVAQKHALVTMGKISALAGRVAGDCVLWAARAARFTVPANMRSKG